MLRFGECEKRVLFNPRKLKKYIRSTQEYEIGIDLKNLQNKNLNKQTI